MEQLRRRLAERLQNQKSGNTAQAAANQQELLVVAAGQGLRRLRRWLLQRPSQRQTQRLRRMERQLCMQPRPHRPPLLPTPRRRQQR
jgi:hypothetical protein